MGQNIESGYELTPEREEYWRRWAEKATDDAMPEILAWQDKIDAEEREKELRLVWTRENNRLRLYGVGSSESPG